MRIGILQTDSVEAGLTSRHGDYPHMFRRLLADPAARPAGLPAPAFVDIDARRGMFPEPSDCDAYVITGSRHSVYDPLPWIASLAGFVSTVLEQGRRVVGVCFGHQLLAHFSGGETRPAAAGWCVGVQGARVVRRFPWMDPFAARFELCVSHRDQVARVPPGADVFAVADACPVAGFVMGNALAIQGHPEFSRAYVRALMDGRREALGETVYAAGTASLAHDVDATLLGCWMLRFMSRDTA